MNIHLITFATTTWPISHQRFTEDFSHLKEKYENIKSIHVLTENDLDEKYRNRFNDHVSDQAYAYWSWKPYIIKQLFDQIGENDIIYYMDGGCVLPKNGTVEQTKWMIDTECCITDMMNNFQYIGMHLWENRDRDNIRIVRKEILSKFDLIDNKAFLYYYPHYEAGNIILIKNEISRNILEQWNNFFFNEYETCIKSGFLDGTGQYPEFIHNGADQAILQCILFKNNSSVHLINFIDKYNIIQRYKC